MASCLTIDNKVGINYDPTTQLITLNDGGATSSYIKNSGNGACGNPLSSNIDGSQYSINNLNTLSVLSLDGVLNTDTGVTAGVNIKSVNSIAGLGNNNVQVSSNLDVVDIYGNSKDITFGKCTGSTLVTTNLKASSGNLKVGSNLDMMSVTENITELSQYEIDHADGYLYTGFPTDSNPDTIYGPSDNTATVISYVGPMTTILYIEKEKATENLGLVYKYECIPFGTFLSMYNTDGERIPHVYLRRDDKIVVVIPYSSYENSVDQNQCAIYLKITGFSNYLGMGYNFDVSLPDTELTTTATTYNDIKNIKTAFMTTLSSNSTADISAISNIDFGNKYSLNNANQVNSNYVLAKSISSDAGILDSLTANTLNFKTGQFKSGSITNLTSIGNIGIDNSTGTLYNVNIEGKSISADVLTPKLINCNLGYINNVDTITVKNLSNVVLLNNSTPLTYATLPPCNLVLSNNTLLANNSSLVTGNTIDLKSISEFSNPVTFDNGLSVTTGGIDCKSGAISNVSTLNGGTPITSTNLSPCNLSISNNTLTATNGSTTSGTTANLKSISEFSNPVTFDNGLSVTTGGLTVNAGGIDCKSGAISNVSTINGGTPYTTANLPVNNLSMASNILTSSIGSTSGTSVDLKTISEFSNSVTFKSGANVKGNFYIYPNGTDYAMSVTNGKIILKSDVEVIGKLIANNSYESAFSTRYFCPFPYDWTIKNIQKNGTGGVQLVNPWVSSWQTKTFGNGKYNVLNSGWYGWSTATGEGNSGCGYFYWYSPLDYATLPNYLISRIQPTGTSDNSDTYYFGKFGWMSGGYALSGDYGSNTGLNLIHFDSSECTQAPYNSPNVGFDCILYRFADHRANGIGNTLIYPYNGILINSYRTACYKYTRNVNIGFPLGVGIDDIPAWSTYYTYEFVSATNHGFDEVGDATNCNIAIQKSFEYRVAYTYATDFPEIIGNLSSQSEYMGINILDALNNYPAIDGDGSNLCYFAEHLCPFDNQWYKLHYDNQFYFET